jgi:hypothetical protein
LQVLNTALAQRQNQIVSLIDSSNQVFQAFAGERGNGSQGVRLFFSSRRRHTS